MNISVSRIGLPAGSNIGVVVYWSAAGARPRLRKGMRVGSTSLAVDASSGDVVCWGILSGRGWQRKALWGQVLDDGTVRKFDGLATARRFWLMSGNQRVRTSGVSQQPRVVDLPAEVIEHVQKLTEANQTLAEAVVRLRTALVKEGHSSDCPLVLGDDACACPASTGAGIMAPEQIAERYGRMREQYSRALVREQQVRTVLQVRADEDTVEFCKGLIASVKDMYEAARTLTEMQQVKEAQAQTLTEEEPSDGS